MLKFSLNKNYRSNKRLSFEENPNASVVIVGNGPVKDKVGYLIDDFDVVVRFKHFELKGHEEFVGTKTTVWVYTTACFSPCKHQSNPYEETWAYKIRFKINKEMTEKARRDNSALFLVPPKAWRHVNQKTHLCPSTGMLAIQTALTYFKGPIFLFGFTGKTDGKIHHYWTEKPSWDGQHNWKAEKKIIDELVENGRIEILGE